MILAIIIILAVLILIGIWQDKIWLAQRPFPPAAWVQSSGVCDKCKTSGVPVATVILDSGNQIGILSVCSACYKKLAN